MATDGPGESRLRILLVNDYCDRAGGAEEMLHLEAELLESRGHRVESVGFGRPSEDRSVETDHVFYESDNRVRRIAEKIAVSPRIYRGLRRLVLSVDPDVVHVHKNVNYPATVLAACRGVPVVKTHHDFTNVCPSGWAVYQDSRDVCPGGPGPKCVRHDCKSVPEMSLYHGPRHAVRRPLQRRVVDRHLAPSHALYRYLDRFGYTASVLPNPARDRFDRAPGDGPGEPYFLYVGAHEEKKGGSTLVDALAEADGRLRAVFAGLGEDRSEWINRAERLGVSGRTEFRGYVDDDELADLYADCRAVVVPSIWMENFPTVVSEAFLMRRPVVGSDRGGIPEMLADGRGLIYPAGDAVALADRLETYHQRPEWAASAGAAGYEYATGRLDPDRFTASLVDVFRSVADA